MKLNFKRYFYSFSTKLSLYILLVVALIFILGFVGSYRTSREFVYNEAVERVKISLGRTVDEIDNVLFSVETAVKNMSWVVKEYSDNPEAMYKITYMMLADNPFICGSAVAFEPNYFKEKGHYFSPYSYLKGDSICQKQLGNSNYDYHYDDWYQIPKLLEKPYWSEPYFDEGGGNTMMTTYSFPIYDDEGKMYAVFTADVSLEWLANKVNEVKPYSNSFNLMIGRGGTYIVHADKEFILNESFFVSRFAMKDSRFKDVGHSMVNGEDGVAVFERDGRDFFFVYMPVKTTGWSVAVACLYDEVFAGVDSMRDSMYVIAVVVLLIMALICYVIIYRLAAPLTLFAQSANDIARGNFSVKLPHIKSRNEMSVLRDSFEYMQRSLLKYTEELKLTTANKERIESELRIARNIQMGMIPKIFPPFPEREDIDLYAMLEPAKEVGGDLYDFFIEDNKLYFAVGDVSGKGVPASLLMAVTCRLFRTVAAGNCDPAAIVSLLNNALSESNESNMFCTFFVGILDLCNGELKYCNAGHNAPYLIADNGEVNTLDVEPNLALGVFAGFPYEGQKTVLKGGTGLFLYTDGVTEAENVSKVLYDETRLARVLATSSGNAEAFVRSVRSSVKEHVVDAEQSDDITMLCLVFNVSENVEKSFEKKLELVNDISEISKLPIFVDEIAATLSLSQEFVFNFNLVLEEAVTNVVMYAYPQGKSGPITLVAKYSKGEIAFILSDEGVPFDPTKVPDADVTLPAEERRIGGLGIYLIRQIMDNVSYRYNERRNILIMNKQVK